LIRESLRQIPERLFKAYEFFRNVTRRRRVRHLKTPDIHFAGAIIRKGRIWAQNFVLLQMNFAWR
jgi:hypothetical protein